MTLLGSRSSDWLAASEGLGALAARTVSGACRRTAAAADDARPSALRPLIFRICWSTSRWVARRYARFAPSSRIAPELAWDDPCLLSAAAEVAWAFRTLFNQHDAVALLRRDTDDHYWRRVLTYGAQHNLQAVLDEYAHYLVDAEGLGASPAEERATGVAHAMPVPCPSAHRRSTSMIAGRRRLLAIRKFQMRGRFAMRLADYKDEEGGVARLGGVREAFNSPFRPFVLATTSVGQEGLDFHPYCYRVYHWNLPSNPVDLEQREGRVHRFKGHAIRLNLAERQTSAIRGRGRLRTIPGG